MRARVSTLNKTRFNTAQQLHGERAWTADWDWTHAPRPTDAILMTGDTVQRWFTVALTKDDDSGAKKTGQVEQERASVYGISSRQKCCIESEYLHILLCELWIYFYQTRDDCKKTNQECFVIFSEYRVCMEYVWWDDKAVKLVLVWYETWIQKNSCIFFFSD